MKVRFGAGCGLASLLCALVLLPVTRADATDADPLDSWSRAAVRSAYLAQLQPALTVPTGWTGSVAGCVAGSISDAASGAALTTVNFFRDLADLPRVAFDAALSAKAQQAALMMDAKGQLSHLPTPDWPCYTPEGADGAGSSNLSLGRPSAAASIAEGYLRDPGAGNTAAGHRRWVLFPGTRSMGLGQTATANALYVVAPDTDWSAVGPWTPWPTAGYVPLPLEPGGRWSLSAPDAETSFAAATVEVVDVAAGTSLPLTVHPVQDGAGNSTVVWELGSGIAASGERTYAVTVAGIARGGQVMTHRYSVRLFDPTAEGPQVDLPRPSTTAEAGPSATPSPGATGQPPSPTPSASPTTAPSGTPTATPAATVTPTAAVTPTATPIPTGSGSPTPTASSSPVPPPERQPTLSLSPAVIDAQQRVTVTYRGTPGATLSIWSKTQPATGFSWIGSVRLDASGLGTSSHAPRKNTRLMAKTASGVASGQPLIQVRSVASLNGRASGVRTLTFSGTVSPPVAGRLVSLYRNGTLMAQGRTSSSGVYSITKALPRGTWSVVARTRNDVYNLGATSRTLRVTVS